MYLILAQITNSNQGTSFLSLLKKALNQTKPNPTQTPYHMEELRKPAPSLQLLFYYGCPTKMMLRYFLSFQQVKDSAYPSPINIPHERPTLKVGVRGPK